MNIRPAEQSEIDYLARLWYDGWQDGHAGISPEELIRRRTLQSFTDRLHADLPNLRVAGPLGQPTGFSIIKGDELYQFYVSTQARGTGLAALLMADAEACLAANGVKTAWLACAIGNDRAARFYEKSGWRRVGTITSQLETSDGLFPLEVWRYEKELFPR